MNLPIINHKYIKLYETIEEYEADKDNFSEVLYSIIKDGRANNNNKSEYKFSIRTTNNDNLIKGIYWNFENIDLIAGLNIVWGYFGFQYTNYIYNDISYLGGNFTFTKPMNVVKEVFDANILYHIKEFLRYSISTNKIKEIQYFDTSNIIYGSYVFYNLDNNVNIDKRVIINWENLKTIGFYFINNNKLVFDNLDDGDVINFKNVINIEDKGLDNSIVYEVAPIRINLASLMDESFVDVYSPNHMNYIKMNKGNSYKFNDYFNINNKPVITHYVALFENFIDEEDLYSNTIDIRVDKIEKDNINTYFNIFPSKNINSFILYGQEDGKNVIYNFNIEYVENENNKFNNIVLYNLTDTNILPNININNNSDVYINTCTINNSIGTNSKGEIRYSNIYTTIYGDFTLYNNTFYNNITNNLTDNNTIYNNIFNEYTIIKLKSDISTIKYNIENNTFNKNLDINLDKQSTEINFNYNTVKGKFNIISERSNTLYGKNLNIENCTFEDDVSIYVYKRLYITGCTINTKLDIEANDRIYITIKNVDNGIINLNDIGGLQIINSNININNITLFDGYKEIAITNSTINNSINIDSLQSFVIELTNVVFAFDENNKYLFDADIINTVIKSYSIITDKDSEIDNITYVNPQTTIGILEIDTYVPQIDFNPANKIILKLHTSLTANIDFFHYSGANYNDITITSDTLENINIYIHDVVSSTFSYPNINLSECTNIKTLIINLNLYPNNKINKINIDLSNNYNIDAETLYNSLMSFNNYTKEISTLTIENSVYINFTEEQVNNLSNIYVINILHKDEN